MGGHGGLNILPQKRWNVYRYDNREKVRRDEEEAAKEEQIKRNQSRKRDAEFRLERLRASKGIAPLIEAEVQSNEQEVHVNETEHVSISSPNSGHINLFEGIKIFDPIREPQKDESGEKERKKMKKMKKEEVVVTPEDEKYRFGYSYLGKQVKLPWYLEKRNDDDDDDGGESSGKGEKSEKNKRGKKTLEELREERLKREKVEKERERALIHGKQKSDRVPFGSSRFYRR
ncbi:putative CBF1-interacting co-repressor CIR domain-containing protein [Lupinus albus]|uniref:Putative CBF1-interacting co-repressor CIR domain-containing protein n=1 Tax=Lupinus albus TaxID=3870 RepID=A0A6A4P4Q8_LUPAL|nr:putative CBF1-interacting co-repressor CIR domain-containing protein [Lupinus albus]